MPCQCRRTGQHHAAGFFFLRSIGIDVPAISVSVLEDKGNQEVHKQLGVISIKPYMGKAQVLQQLGFPVVSKAKANKISYLLQPDAEKQTFIHAIMTGDMGKQGGYKHSDRIKLQDKWIKLFGGNYRDMRPERKRCKTLFGTLTHWACHTVIIWRCQTTKGEKRCEICSTKKTPAPAATGNGGMGKK